MCGICGVYAYDAAAAPVDAEELTRIRDAMTRRGPDGAGAWLSPDGRTGFGHRRLSIIELSDAGSQPMRDRDGRLTIVFNGEIYNYRALRDALVGAGTRFNSHSDTEVILALYRRHGVDAFRRLRGMYAIAIWDEERRCLVLARDPFGIKPLYVADDGRTLRFASQVKALLAPGSIDRAPDPAGHAGFFLWGHVPEPFTLYRNIASFPAGHYRVVRATGAETPVAFAVPGDVLRAAERGPPPGPMNGRLHDLLFDSVDHHHVADVPVGVFLSAGRDSTVIASLSCEARGHDLQTFTLGFSSFRGTERDEVPLAEEVAHALGTRQSTAWVAENEFARARDDILDVMDQPSVDGINTYFVARMTAAAGIKVALSGLGGDEIFGGYPSFTGVPRAVAWFSAVPPPLGRLARLAAAPFVGHLTSPKYAGLLEFGGSIPGAYLLRRALHMPWELPQLLGHDMAAEGLARLQPMERMAEAVRGIRDPYNAVMLLEMQCYMASRLLRDSDWASMAHSLELRVPLVDWHLFEALAPYLAHAGRPRKADLAASPRNSLPPAVLQRRKTGFEVPVRDWLLHGNAETATRRGLRSWAPHVYRAFREGADERSSRVAATVAIDLL